MIYGNLNQLLATHLYTGQSSEVKNHLINPFHGFSHFHHNIIQRGCDEPMFLRCSSVIAFWKTFQIWWTIKTTQQLVLSISMILYGVFDKAEHGYPLNYMLLIAKFSVYCRRVSMGLTVKWPKNQPSTVKHGSFTVNRQMSEPILAVKFLFLIF